MNRAVAPLHVVSWIFCILTFGLSSASLGQYALPPLLPVNVPNFTIPFEISGSAGIIREVELLVSQDRGRRWNVVARQPVETEKFAFRADGDGEYWFAFRTVTLTGDVNPMTGTPELRVLVNTKNPAAVPSAQRSESGPVIPPKPERFRSGNTPRPQPQPMQLTKAEEPKTSEPIADERTTKPESEAKPEKGNAERSTQVLVPKFPGFDLPEPETNREGDLLGDLLSGMSAFMDVQPVEIKRNFVPQDSHLPRPSTETSAGSIAGIDMKNGTDTRSQIVVKWHTGGEPWRDAQVDILRSSTEGQWSPIVINLPNNGEYWWYLSPEDLKPFYIAIRIRSLHSGSSVDVTQRKIEIDSRLAVFQSPHL